MSKNFTQVGTTYGLAISAVRESKQAEQVYVRLNDPLDAETGNFPVQIDAWVGYSSIARMNLTKRQAKELALLLIEAVTR